MKKDRICKYCDVLFPNEEGKVFSNHVRWCKKNTTNGDKGVKNVAKAFKNSVEKKILQEKGQITEFDVSCFRCSKIFVIKEWSKLYPQKNRYFCSRSCANSRGPRNEEFKQKVLKKWHAKDKSEIIEIQLKRKINSSFTKDTIYRNQVCPSCGTEFQVYQRHNKTFCTRKCQIDSKRKENEGTLRSYRKMCEFQFAIKDYPNEFDIGLIKEYGWYSAKNNGDNPGGVSRDHIVSVLYGYKNGIDPKIISHPANCQLLRQSDNFLKRDKCDLTIDELIKKINHWNDKYGYSGN